MHAYKIGIFILCLLQPYALNAASVEDIKATLFREARDALGLANEAKANLYAPVTYAAGAEEYRRAEATLADGGNIEGIKRDLAQARDLFAKAAKATELTRVALNDAIQARNDAISAEAGKFASAEWTGAERTFATAVTRLEEGNARTAQRMGTQAVDEYRTAELSAIKANYLNETESLLEQAEDARAKRYAPTTFARAQELYATAESELTKDRYDTDRPRSLAQQAKYEAQHALYLAGLSKQVKDRKLSVEEVVLTWESAIRRIGDRLDAPTYFAQGAEPSTTKIDSLIAELQQHASAADNTVLGLRKQIDVMDQQIAALETRLGGEKTAVARMNEVVAQQERLQSRLDQVDDLFAEEEAIVLRKGDDVIIRMVGLNFDFAKETIKTEHYPLLGKLREAFNLFPASRIVIEGHTDSYGSDEQNFALSERRAKAVKEYLHSVSGTLVRDINSVGFGETKPAANNETAEGRTRNRRIDVVIFDAGTLEGG